VTQNVHSGKGLIGRIHSKVWKSASGCAATAFGSPSVPLHPRTRCVTRIASWKWMATSTFHMITGRGGQTLRDKWQSGASGPSSDYTATDFPTCLSGPGHKAGVGSSISPARSRLTPTMDVEDLARARRPRRRHQERAGERIRRTLPRGRHKNSAVARLLILLQRARGRGATVVWHITGGRKSGMSFAPQPRRPQTLPFFDAPPADGGDGKMMRVPYSTLADATD
jgi:hypothetical protein